MKRKRFTEEQIVAVLQEAAAPGSGRAVARRHGITETTLYRWRAKYGGMRQPEVKRLRQLEDENGRLKLLRRDGWTVNLRRVLRVYRAAGLRIRRRRPRQQVSAPRVPRPVAEGPNAPWTPDFIHDQLADGRRFRVLSVVGECTRECLALRAEHSLPSWRVAETLDAVAAARGAPRRAILDDGPEMVARALDAWAYGRGVELASTRRAKPVDHCYVESFHDRLRDECDGCLSTHRFLDLADARAIIGAWRDDYNAVRPPSSLGYRTPTEYAAMLRANLELESAPHLSPT